MTYAGCPVFPSSDWFYQDVTNGDLAPNSASLIAQTAGYSPGTYVFALENEKVNLATNATATWPVVFGGSHQQAFPSRMPWGSNFFVEGSGDSHSFVLNTDTCTDYETYGTSFSGSAVNVSTGGAYTLNQTFAQNLVAWPQLVHYPAWGMTGIPQFPLMLKWDYDLATGSVNHALAVNISDATLSNRNFVPPAQTGILPPGIPSGAHLRLHASWTQSGLNSQQQAVVAALKKYGAFVMDNGVPISIYALKPADGNNSHYNLPNMNIHVSDFDLIQATCNGKTGGPTTC